MTLVLLLAAIAGSAIVFFASRRIIGHTGGHDDVSTNVRIIWVVCVVLALSSLVLLLVFRPNIDSGVYLVFEGIALLAVGLFSLTQRR
jgi:hypothetical protein